MNDTNRQTSLQQLFAQARDNQPPLDDDVFTSAVMAQISAAAELTTSHGTNPAVNYLEDKQRFTWVDALGLGVGVAACFAVVDPSQLASQVVALTSSVLPDKLVLSPLTVIGAAGGMAALCISAWFALEGDLQN